jgi:hypothetical protein
MVSSNNLGAEILQSRLRFSKRGGYRGEAERASGLLRLAHDDNELRSLRRGAGRRSNLGRHRDQRRAGVPLSGLRVTDPTCIPTGTSGPRGPGEAVAGSDVLVEHFPPGVLACSAFDEAGLFAGGNRACEAKWGV